MRIVITGATGFLGRALLRKLDISGVEVIGISRQSLPGFVQVSSYANAPGGDVLVHLAEISDRRLAEADGQAYERWALLALESLIGKGFEQIVYASSAALYGDQREGPSKVGDPICVVDTYTRLKYATERMVLENGGVVARLVNLYGPGMAEGNVLGTILKQIPLGGPIRVFDLSPIRDFLWIDDAAEALRMMILGKVSGIFNVGTAVGTSVLQLANIVLSVAGQKGRPTMSTNQTSRRSQLIVDIAQTIAELGWRPSTSLEDGLRTLVKTYQQIRRPI